MGNNLFLLYGDEAYLIDDDIQKFKREYVPEGMASFAYEVIKEKNVDINNLINVIQTLPAFSPTRLVVIKDFEYLIKKSLDDKEEALLISSLENIPDGVIVVFAVYGKVDLRKRLSKFMKKNAEVREYKPFAFWEQAKLLQWLQALVAKKGVQISREGAQLLTEIAGPSLRALSNEIDKIITYIGERKNIEATDVKLMGSPGEIIGFDLNNALTHRDPNKMILLINRMIKEGTAPVVILGMLVAQVRLLLQIKDGLSGGASMQELSAKLGKNPYYLKKLAEGINRYTFQEMKELYFELQETDVKINTGKQEPKLALELVVSSLTS